MMHLVLKARGGNKELIVRWDCKPTYLPGLIYTTSARRRLKSAVTVACCLYLKDL